MKVNIKTIIGKDYTIETNPGCTISELKTLLAQKYEFNIQQIVLIFNKNILRDEDTLESIRYDEKMFLVLHKQIHPIVLHRDPKDKDRKHKAMLDKGHLTRGLSDNYEEDDSLQDNETFEEDEDYDEYGNDEEEEDSSDFDQGSLNPDIFNFYEKLDPQLKAYFNQLRENGMKPEEIIRLFQETKNNIAIISKHLNDKS